MTGSLSVVLVGEGCAEEGHNPVTGELVDRPLVLVDLIHENTKAAVHDAVDLFRVELLGEGGEVRDVGEEDGDELALTLHGASRGENLVREKLGRVGVGLREVGRRGGFRGRQRLAAFSAEFELRRIGKVALRADPLQPGTAFSAEFHPIRVFDLALGAFHRYPPLLTYRGAYRTVNLCL